MNGKTRPLFFNENLDKIYRCFQMQMCKMDHSACDLAIVSRCVCVCVCDVWCLEEEECR